MTGVSKVALVLVLLGLLIRCAYATASDPAGGQRFWFDGLPWTGITYQANDQGTTTFWYDGLPGPDVFPVPPAAGVGSRRLMRWMGR